MRTFLFTQYETGWKKNRSNSLNSNFLERSFEKTFPKEKLSQISLDYGFPKQISCAGIPIIPSSSVWAKQRRIFAFMQQFVSNLKTLLKHLARTFQIARHLYDTTSLYCQFLWNTRKYLSCGIVDNRSLWKGRDYGYPKIRLDTPCLNTQPNT